MRVHVTQFVAATTPEQRKLAELLDTIHSLWTYASCTGAGEANALWAELVSYDRGDTVSLTNGNVHPGDPERALAQIRKLGGTWADGQLCEAAESRVAALSAAFRGGIVDEAYLDDPARWVTLDEMAALTGLRLAP